MKLPAPEALRKAHAFPPEGSRVLVAMSGGIDSSVTAALLHYAGYDIVGLTMKTWDYAHSGGNSGKETGCCSLDSINDARQVAVDLGFPHYIIDIREEFGESVIDYFVDEYLAGRTPNPCVMCNTHIKWDALLKRADQLGCAYIATGHYAQLKPYNGRTVIISGADPRKDQAYVLWGVSQASLQRTVFPIGGFEKAEIRAMAREMGFEFLANKPESYEICFVPDNDYRGFLDRRAAERTAPLEGGDFVTPDGTVVGRHRGYPFYTIGQRKGLVAMGTPHYVTEIRPETNTVVIGPVDELQRSRFTVKGLNLLKYKTLPEEGIEVACKIRYNSEPQPASLQQTGPATAEVEFAAPVQAIAPGQAAVFFHGPEVVGGGWIDRVLPQQ